jgi:hypothetical protein
MVADEENRVRKFEQGLNPRIHDRVVCFEIQNFVELVNKASITEESEEKCYGDGVTKEGCTSAESKPSRMET